VYTYFYKDKLAKKMERDRAVAERKAIAEQKRQLKRELDRFRLARWHLNWEPAQIKTKNIVRAREREIRRQIWENGKANARRVIEYHLVHGGTPSVDMWAVINRYK
jgi:hypothetical protein